MMQVSFAVVSRLFDEDLLAPALPRAMLAEPLLSAPSPARRTSSCSKDVVTVCIIATGAVLLLFATCSPATRPPSRFNAVLTVSADDSHTVVANETRARLAQITRAPVDGLSDGEEAVPRLRESDGTDAQERAGVMTVDASASAPSAVGRSPEIWLWSRRLGDDTWWSWWCEDVVSNWC